MRKAIEQRLAAAERRLKPKHKTRVIEVSGGFPIPVQWAEGGGLRWTRPLEETYDAFRDRVTAEAEAAHVEWVVIGGLPPDWWKFPEGWTPEDIDYPEVPPEEPS